MRGRNSRWWGWRCGVWVVDMILLVERIGWLGEGDVDRIKWSVM